MSKRINLSGEKWEDLMNKIDNEGFGYYVMDYQSPEGFSEDVDGDAEAVRLFTQAQILMTDLAKYLKLDEW